MWKHSIGYVNEDSGTDKSTYGGGTGKTVMVWTPICSIGHNLNNKLNKIRCVGLHACGTGHKLNGVVTDRAVY